MCENICNNEPIKIIFNVQVTEDIYEMRFYNESLKRSKAGQFIMMDCVPSKVRKYSHDLFLRRPFSLFYQNDCEFKILYKHVGNGTRILKGLRNGDELSFTGPIGKPIDLSICKDKNIYLIAGGMGVAPLTFLAQKLIKSNFNYPNLYIGLNEYNNLTPTLLCELLTIGMMRNDIGLSYEKQTYDLTHPTCELPKKIIVGNVLQLFLTRSNLKDNNNIVFACGPKEMMKKLHYVCWSMSIPCYIFVERHMGCGMGSCHVCSIGSKHVCTDGPCFLSSDIFGEI